MSSTTGRSYRHFDDVSGVSSMVSPIRQLLDQSLQKIKDEESSMIAQMSSSNSILRTRGSPDRSKDTSKETSYDLNTSRETSYGTALDTSYETTYTTTTDTTYKRSHARKHKYKQNHPRSSPRMVSEDHRRPYESDIYPTSASSIIASDPNYYCISPKASDVSSTVTSTQIIPDVLVVTKDNHEFRHSSLLLNYISPVFSHHWKPMKHGEFRLDLPNTTQKEWTRIQGFLEPPTKQLPATVDVRYLSQLLPWFTTLQFDHLLDYVDKMLMSLIHSVLHDSPLCLSLLQLTHYCPELVSTRELALRRTEQVLLSATDIPEDDLRKFLSLLQDNASIRKELWRSVVVGLPSDLKGDSQDLVRNPLFFYLYRQGLLAHKAAMKEEGVTFRSNPITWGEWLESEGIHDDSVTCRDWIEEILREIQLPRLLKSASYDASTRTFSC